MEIKKTCETENLTSPPKFPGSKYIVQFVLEFRDFRFAELDSVCELFGIDPTQAYDIK